MKPILLVMDGMTLDDLVMIARHGAGVHLTKSSEKRIIKSRKLIDIWVRQRKTIYGVTTGFGALSDVSIPQKDARRLQINILMSHAAGVGNFLDQK